jgi:ribose-phosphate pyrophosphokinase
MHQRFLPQLPFAFVPLQWGFRLAREVAATLQVPAMRYNLAPMPDGMPHITFPCAVDAPNLWVCGYVDAAPETLQTLFALSTALKRYPGELCLMLTYNAYGRDEVLAHSFLKLLRSMGFSTIVCVEPHIPRGAHGYYVLSLDALIATELRRIEPHASTVLIAPDGGASARVGRLAQALKLPFFTLHKTRLSSLAVTIQAPLHRDVAGKICVVVDDIISTGETLMQTLSVLEKAGAVGAHVLAVHGVFVGGAFDKLMQTPFLKSLRVTNSLPQLYSHEKFQVMNIAPELAPFIRDFRL